MRTVGLKVPATTANIGPGFDCLGMALDVFNEFTVEEVESGLKISGCAKEYDCEDNLFYRAMVYAFKKMNYDCKGYNINFKCDIPVCRGLGSSASLIVGGIAAAQILAGGKCRNEKILKWGTEIEGHPDNIAPAVFGGLCISGMNDGNVFASRVNVADFFEIMVLIPDFELPTSLARSVLPEKILFTDAVFNISRSLMLIESMKNGDFRMLKTSIADKMHQPYRGKLIPGYENIAGELNKSPEHCFFISGAGPSIIILRDKKASRNTNLYCEAIPANWKCRCVAICEAGFSITDMGW